MSVKLHAAEVFGLDAHIIDVEVDLTSGSLHTFSIVGLPDKAIEESKERVGAAIKNSGFKHPSKSRKRVVVSLAPADVKKEGPVFDLSIALGFLLAMREVRFNPQGKLFLGELALDGKVRPIRGVLALAQKAISEGIFEVFVPRGNGREAALVNGIRIYEVSSLSDVLEHLEGRVEIPPLPQTHIKKEVVSFDIDFSDIRGQEQAKRGLEIAAAGAHHVLLSGPPGTGKTLLARSLVSILPDLSHEEILDVTKIYSVSCLLKNRVVVTERPFRNPHHTASYVSLVGGGMYPKPGEITMAHRGVLFLDEFPEFERRVLESLRQPLEDRTVVVSRAKGTMVFPAHIMFVAAMNPCPCGNIGSSKECICSQGQLQKYQRKISGPIVDRIDMWLWVPAVEHKKLLSDVSTGEPSSVIKTRVQRARDIQAHRFAKTHLYTNSEMGPRDIKNWCALGDEEKDIISQAVKNLNLSARSYHRVLKLARTIADLDGSARIQKNHLLEALSFRPQTSDIYG